MGPYGSLQVFNRPDGFKWILVGPYASLWVLMSPNWSLWIFM